MKKVLESVRGIAGLLTLFERRDIEIKLLVASHDKGVAAKMLRDNRQREKREELACCWIHCGYTYAPSSVSSGPEL